MLIGKFPAFHKDTGFFALRLNGKSIINYVADDGRCSPLLRTGQSMLY